jgi:hypothetical protein
MNYERLKSTHDRLAAKHGQGLVEITTTTTTDGPNPWDPPVTTTTETPVDAVVSGVGAEYVDGSSIVASDLQVQIAAVEDAPEVGDTIKIDGASKAVLAVMPVPGSGDPVAIKMIVRG